MPEKADVTPYETSMDFTIWKVKMRTVLVRQKLWNIVNTEKERKKMTDVEKETNQKAFGEIIIRLSDCVARQFLDHTSANLLWKALEEAYSVKSLPS